MGQRPYRLISLTGIAVAGLSIGLAASIVACTGSSSETPWPAEPSDVDLGPGGEEDVTGAKATATARATTAPPAKSAKPKATSPENVRSP